MIAYHIYLKKGIVTFKRITNRQAGGIMVYLMPPLRVMMDEEIGMDELPFVRGLIRAIIANEGLSQDEGGFLR